MFTLKLDSSSAGVTYACLCTHNVMVPSSFIKCITRIKNYAANESTVPIFETQFDWKQEAYTETTTWCSIWQNAEVSSKLNNCIRVHSTHARTRTHPTLFPKFRWDEKAGRRGFQLRPPPSCPSPFHPHTPLPCPTYLSRNDAITFSTL